MTMFCLDMKRDPLQRRNLYQEEGISGCGGGADTEDEGAS